MQRRFNAITIDKGKSPAKSRLRVNLSTEQSEMRENTTNALP